MNIYLITIGTFGLIGLIRTRKKHQENQKQITTYIDCWNNVHKSTKQDIFINVVYKLLYVFSLCQIKYNKMFKYVINKYYNNKKIDKKILLLDKNASTIDRLDFDDDINSELEYSGLFLLDGPNMVFYETIPDTFDYKVSQIHFINVDLEYNNEMYPIKLKTDNVNYYIVNNSLNAFFIKYYILNVLKISINENEPFHYTIHIIDHNVNCITLNQVQRLIITEDGYEIE
jgi:hypothetical protein